MTGGNDILFVIFVCHKSEIMKIILFICYSLFCVQKDKAKKIDTKCDALINNEKAEITRSL